MNRAARELAGVTCPGPELVFIMLALISRLVALSGYYPAISSYFVTRDDGSPRANRA